MPKDKKTPKESPTTKESNNGKLLDDKKQPTDTQTNIELLNDVQSSTNAAQNDNVGDGTNSKLENDTHVTANEKSSAVVKLGVDLSKFIYIHVLFYLVLISKGRGSLYSKQITVIRTLEFTSNSFRIKLFV